MDVDVVHSRAADACWVLGVAGAAAGAGPGFAGCQFVGLAVGAVDVEFPSCLPEPAASRLSEMARAPASRSDANACRVNVGVPDGDTDTARPRSEPLRTS